MYDFQRLVADCELSDLGYTGPKFTWWNHRDADPIGKKLDRALVNTAWSSSFSTSSASFESNGISDHVRCVVKMTDVDQQKRHHFQFFNYLTQHPQFMETVASYWNEREEIYHSHTALLRLHKKLKGLKPYLKVLNRDRYGDITRRTKIAYDVLCARQNQVLENPCAETFEAENQAARQWHHYAEIEESFFKQKSRITWLKLGDHNTAFFHRMVQLRKSKNSIRKLINASGDEITDQQDIKSEAVGYFKNFLQKTTYTDHNFDDLEELIDYRCPESTAAMLVGGVTEQDIRQTLISMPSEKTPGPDGYTKEFFVTAWPIVGKDFTNAVQSFFQNGFMPNSINATALCLVPKKVEAVLMTDFRPIACCNTVYKVISKILANRLKQILPEAIKRNQSAFIRDRLLLENVLLATELVKDYHKDKISPRFAFKIDIAKAFDTVRWDFILRTLKTMGIPDQFIQWIQKCVSTAAFLVNINGELSGFFTSTRGLRQGCSLSPILFVIAINVLSYRLNKAAKTNMFGYHPLCQEVELTHLSFADDMIIFGEGTVKSLLGILEVLKDFEQESGLAINVSKSDLYMAGETHPELHQRVTNLRIPTGHLPIRYLGLPLTTKRMTKLDYEPLIEKIRNRFLSWTSKSLSYAGRLQLIQAVISSITNFWCSAFHLPKKCLQCIEQMSAAFLWSGTPHITTKAKVSWNDVCIPKKEGGLGVRRLMESSNMFLLKLIWRLLSKTDSFWVSWVWKFLVRKSSFWDLSDRTSSGSWMWKKILKKRPLALQFIKMEVHNGEDTFFWHDIWCTTMPLIRYAGERGPQLLGIGKNGKVADAAFNGEWTFRHARGQLRELAETIRHVMPPRQDAGKDWILWKQKDDCYEHRFSSKHTWEQLRNPRQAVSWFCLVWFRHSVPRYGFITWLAMQNRLDTGDRVALWGRQQPCILCGEPNKTRDHVFFACPYSYTIWHYLMSEILGSRTDPDWLSTVILLSGNRLSKRDSLLARMTFQTVIYWVWRERNARRHMLPCTTTVTLTNRIHKDLRNRLISLQSDATDTDMDALSRWNSIVLPNENTS